MTSSATVGFGRIILGGKAGDDLADIGASVALAAECRG